MHVMFVTYDANGISRPAGGVATFISHFSALLRFTGNEVTVLYANRTRLPMDVRWQTAYLSQGINIVRINSDQDVNLSVEVASHVQLADVVYFQDWHSHAFYTVQQRRFTSRRCPTCVLVLHGASAWLQAGKNSGLLSLDDLAAEFMEGYSAQYCDFVASPSRAMLSWVKSRGWVLPPGEHTRVLGLPLLPVNAKSETTVQASTFKRIVFFGRREKHKGFELFVDALLLLAKQESECLREIDEIVFLGAENLTSDAAGTRFGRSGAASELLTASTGKPVTSLKHLDSLGAQQYLTERAADTLVIIPSLLDNFPYTAIETSLIPGLNLLCAKTGGLPEILGPDQLFEPDPESMAACLSRWLRHGPLPDDQLSHYDFRAANRRWLDFHDTVSKYKAEPQSQDAATTHTTSIAVCVRYTREAQHLPQLLLSLACQTSQQFAVVVSAAGSHDVQSTAVFEQMQAQYSNRGWAFLQRPRETTALTRNAMANETQAAYLCFMDADTVAAPTMIERLAQAIRQSVNHCLAIPGYVFEGESSPYDLQAQQIMSQDRADLPSVPNPLLEMFDNIPEAMGLVVHQAVFNSIDGYSTDCPEALLDKDLYLRLVLAGYKVDYLPEYLCFVRSSTLVMPTRTDTVTLVSRRLDAYVAQPGKVQPGALTLLIRSLQAQVEALKPGPSQANRETVEPPLAIQIGKLKVLMLLPYFPISPRTGALIRFWEQIRFWGSHHDLTVVTFISPGEEQTYDDMLRPYTTYRVGVIYKKPHVSARSDLPDSVQLYTTPAMMHALQNVDPAKFDIAIVEQIFMGEYHSLLKGLTILTEHNVEYAIPSQITGLAQHHALYGEFSKAAASYKKQSRLMENYEKRMWPRFSLRIAVSEKDQQEIQRHCRTGRTVVVANGTYMNRFITDLNPQSKNILFMGALRYYPNIDGLLYFIDAIWPLLRQRDPDLQLIVAGRSPDPRIISVATQPHVRLIADPEDMADVARECSLSIVPLRVGGGTRIKILDSLAMGLPVVTTSLGCEGLAAHDGTHLLIRDAPSDFTDAVIQLTTDLHLWSELRHNGYQFVRNSFSWDRLFEKMEDAVLQAINRPR